MKMSDSKYSFWGFIAACGMGLIDSIWLVSMHLNKDLQAGCSVNSLVNCSAINHPKYSQWLSIPVSFYALLTFIIISVMFYLWKKSSKNETVLKSKESFISILVWLTIASALYFLAVTVFIIKAFCLYCTIFYVSSLGMLVFWPKLKTSKLKTLETFKNALITKYCLYSVIASVGLLLLAKFTLFVDKQSISKTVNDVMISVNLDKRTLGQRDAQVTIVKFSDFQCPACKQAGMILKDLARESKGTIKLVYKYFPLDPKCNSKMPAGRGHMMACQAAIASLCAADQDQFWSYHDLIFAKQNNLNEKDFEVFAKQLNLDLKTFGQCVESSAAFKTVQNDLKEGDILNIRQTPTIFINGREYQGRITRSGVEEAIEALQN